jgi:starch phosphorylase
LQQLIEVRPALPEPIRRLEELAHNLWFSWNADARSLFYRLDRDLWRRAGHNPILFLRRVSQKKLVAAAKDRTYLEHYNRIMAAFDTYGSDVHTWYSTECDPGARGPIAYFSAEFGVHESLPIFSGGLGVLAGDHCKSASDLGLPLVGMGLLYRKGYFIQHIDSDGRQNDVYESHDFSEMPVSVVHGADGKPVVVAVELADRTVWVKVWEARVGRNPIYLLDADIPENPTHDRLITHQLYGGDMEMRICQEIVLGRGGVRALEALGIEPACWHMNEGHSVFLGLERIRQLVNKAGLSFHEALELVRSTTIFTTHTPVAAGHDAFPLTLKEKYFRMYWEAMGLQRHEFLELGLEVMPEGHEVFSLTVLALNLSAWANGVSRLHGRVSSNMWKDIWPGVPADENPISHITNGVHSLSWLAPEMMDLFDQHLGVEWRANITNPDFWQAVDRVPDSLLWGVHQNLKRRMIERIRERCVDQMIRNGEGAAAIRDADHTLAPDVLTIGFARRFTTYKRATLLFRDLERLKRIVNHPEGPVQLVFAGKAHPADVPGQELLRRVHEISRMPAFKGKIVLVEGYDIAIARYLVSGVDVWLNTPRRPFEASGTSGMKVAMNGGVNFSVLDGWWCEAARHGDNGWSIGDDRDVDDEDRQAQQDSLTIYQLLEETIVPLYYRRNAQGVPDGWTHVAKGSMKTIPPTFNTDRMVSEYGQRFYFPAIAKGRRLAEDSCALARELARWKAFMRAHWHEVQVRWGAHDGHPRLVNFGDKVDLSAEVRLGAIPTRDVLVEAYITEITADSLGGAHRIPLKPAGEGPEGYAEYQGAFVPPDSGRFQVTVRVTPHHPEMVHPQELGLMAWLGAEPRAAGKGRHGGVPAAAGGRSRRTEGS